MNTFMSPATPRALALAPGAFPIGMDFDEGASGTPLGRLGNLLRRRWLLICGCALVAAILAGGLGLRMPRLFTAWAQVVIAPQEPQAAPGLNARGAEDAAMTIETQVSILQSRDLVARVLGRLIATPGFPVLDFAREGTGHRMVRWMVGDLERSAAGPWMAALLGPAWAASLDKLAALPDARQRREIFIDELLRNLKVNSEPRSRVVSVRYTAPSPELAALVVNTVIDTYLAVQKSDKRDGIRQEIARLDKHLPALQVELQAASAQIRAYRLEHAVPDPASGDLLEQQAVTLKRAIKAAETALAQGPTPAGAEDAAALERRRAALQAQLDNLEAGLGDTQPAADRLKELTRLMEAKRQLYEDGLLERQKLVQGQELVTADAALLSAAAPPQKPTSTSPILFLPPALVAGLLIGGLIAIWREALDDGLRSERLLPRQLGIPCAGFLPARPSRSPAPAGRLHAAALRFIAAATLPPSTRDGCRTLLVTSSVSGEESAALAQDLACRAAEFTPRVLLLDARSMPAADRRGRAAIPDKGSAASPDGPILPSPLPGTVLTRPYPTCGLEVLQVTGTGPCRPEHDLPAALKALREAYDCIVMLAGPLLETTEARLLAAEADQVLLAIRWGRTPRSVVENALAVLCRIETAAGKPHGMSAVLTDVHVGRHLAYRFGDAIEALVKADRRRAAG